MVNRWVNPPSRPKVESEFHFDNPTPIDYSPTDLWNKITSQVGKERPRKKKRKEKVTPTNRTGDL